MVFSSTNTVKPLDSLIRECYAKAVASGALLFTKSEITLYREREVDFELRYVPSLAKKPDTKPKEKQRDKSFVNPFLPYDERLHVTSLGSLPTSKPTHQLLLNKYCVVPNHLILVTTDFQQQGDPLTKADFAAVLETVEDISHPQVVFYNSGEESGASQPHKHLQLLPMPESLSILPTVALWLQQQQQATRCLPFAHFGVRLDDTVQLTPDHLLNAYQSAMNAMLKEYSAGTSYNMLLTTSSLLLFPRRLGSWEGVSVNSLGFAGLLLCKTSDQLSLVKKSGVLEILTKVGYAIY